MVPENSHNEQELIRRFQEGDEDAFRLLFESCEGTVQSRIEPLMSKALQRRLSVADVLQEVRIIAFQQRDTFEDRGPGSFRKWLLGIADLRTRHLFRQHAGAALRSIDQEVINLTRSTGAKAIDVFFKVRLPSALPTFFAGFKLAAISATIGAIIGEFIGSDSGLGYIILTANGDLQTDYSFAAISVLTVLGLALYYSVEGLERILLPWHISQRGIFGNR